ncbi:hypothetical protein INT47_003259 [Mucor saturninus]|uniref:Uncharacterized protein n=1 Tax=Mucor saturninus TaxID=64648 RepID=A0A8H7RFZ3_9FUNG|nr:hypothetical protein INT47_003259 [Mucor saturninus]
MPDKVTLNLEEDSDKICEIFSNYFEEQTISAWKYETALRTAIDQGLVVEPTVKNLKILGESYVKEMLRNFKDRSAQCHANEKDKVKSVQESIFTLCSSTRIKKILSVARYTTDYLDKSVSKRVCQELQEEPQPPVTFKTLNSRAKLEFLCEKFGENGHLDLMKHKISGRFKQHLKQLYADFNLKLQPTINRKERKVLLEISKCNTQEQIDALLGTLYAQPEIDDSVRYIRLALSNISELWLSGLLLKEGHGEGWLQGHVYVPLFDNAFTYDKSFVSKRTDCVSSIAKEFDSEDNQKIDFILRNINDSSDYLSCEDKPSAKGVQNDLKKGMTIQKLMLKKWSNYLNSTEIMDKFEAITCQWKGLELTIFATRIISETCTITYNKGTFEVPKESGHGATFARLLAAVLSLRRLVYLNYKKLNNLLQTKQSYSLEQLYFSEDDEDILFKSDSTAPDEFVDNRTNNTTDEGLKERI